jgi:hypothetical protein
VCDELLGLGGDGHHVVEKNGQQTGVAEEPEQTADSPPAAPGRTRATTRSTHT